MQILWLELRVAPQVVPLAVPSDERNLLYLVPSLKQLAGALVPHPSKCLTKTLDDAAFMCDINAMDSAVLFSKARGTTWNLFAHFAKPTRSPSNSA